MLAMSGEADRSFGDVVASYVSPSINSPFASCLLQFSSDVRRNLSCFAFAIRNRRKAIPQIFAIIRLSREILITFAALDACFSRAHNYGNRVLKSCSVFYVYANTRVFIETVIRLIFLFDSG